MYLVIVIPTRDAFLIIHRIDINVNVTPTHQISGLWTLITRNELTSVSLSYIVFPCHLFSSFEKTLTFYFETLSSIWQNLSGSGKTYLSFGNIVPLETKQINSVLYAHCLDRKLRGFLNSTDVRI